MNVGGKDRGSQGREKRVSLPAVQQRQTAIVAAQLAFKTIVKNPLLAILKFDTDKAQAAWNL